MRGLSRFACCPDGWVVSAFWCANIGPDGDQTAMGARCQHPGDGRKNSAKADGSSRRLPRERRDAPAVESGPQDGTVPTCEGYRTYPSRARSSSFRSV